MILNFEELNEKIAPVNEAAAAASRAHWDGIAKPLNGLGRLEEEVVRIAGLTGTERVSIGKRAVLVLCADNGVVAEGVTQTDSSVTAVVADSVSRHQSSVCRMADVAHADVFSIDMGILNRVPGVRDCHVANGTGNLAVEPAMTREQACRAIQQGMDLVKEYKEKGYQILVTGEMGIGNTTTSSALAAVLLDMPVEQVTGRGAGLSDAGLERKRDAIRRGIAVNQPDPRDPLDVLAKLGGYDIAGMVGMFLGGALYRVPVVIDGLISSISALVAARLCPRAVCAMIPSHSSAEPAAVSILKELGLQAVIFAGLKLGEGTGAVCMLSLLDMALSVYNNSATFGDISVDQYVPQGGENK